jgi:WD40 repeat protein
MGAVYKALHLGLNRIVALKVLKAGVGTGEEQRQFRREAEAVARLQHPGIVQVFDIGECCGPNPDDPPRPYFALEFVAGGSLDRQFRQAVLAPRVAALLIERLARAAQAIHELRLVHRDLKPANVLLAPASGGGAGLEKPPAPPGANPTPSLVEDGENWVPKITDFGLALFLDAAQEGAAGLFGTPGYMAPEQAGAGEVTPAVDVHALGAILYEALTGRPPFKGATLAETLEQVCTRSPLPVRRLRPEVPRDLKTICLKCLEKDPARRYATARDLAEDARRFLDGETIRARPVGRIEGGWRRCRRRPVVACLAALTVLSLLALLGSAFWFTAHLGAARGEAAAARRVASTQDYHARLHRVRECAARHRPGWAWAGLDDLEHAAHLDTPARDVLELRAEAAACLGGIDLRPCGTAAEDFNAARLAFSPDGRRLALGQAKSAMFLLCSVRLVDPATGTTELELAFAPSLTWELASKVQDGVRALAFSPDGHHLVVGARSGLLHRWDLTRESPTLVSWPGHQAEVRSLVFSPDGTALFSSADDHTVRRWDVRQQWKATARFAVEGDGPGSRLTMSPGGDWLACTGAGQVHFLAPETLQPTRPALACAAKLLAVSPDGETLAAAHGGSVRLLDRAGTCSRELRPPESDAAHETAVDDLTFSPDGALLASSTPTTGQVRLWERASGRLLAELPVGNGSVRLAFRPCGRLLAVLAGQQTQLYEVGGLAEQTFLAHRPGPIRGMALAPDGQTLACAAEVGGEGEVTLWALDLPGSARARWPVLLSSHRAEARLAIHPNEDWLAVTGRPGVPFFKRSCGRQVEGVPAERVEALTFGPDGRLWVASGEEVRAWAVPGGEAGVSWHNRLSGMLTGLGTVWALAAGQRWVLAGGRDGTVFALRAADARPHASWKRSASGICSLALSADEGLAAVGTWQGELHLCRVPDGELVAQRQPHGECVSAVAFAGDRLATGSHDRTVVLWRVTGGALEEVLTLRVPGPVQGLAFTPNGERLLVLLHKERAVRVWHLDRLHRRLADLGLE